MYQTNVIDVIDSSSTNKVTRHKHKLKTKPKTKSCDVAPCRTLLVQLTFDPASRSTIPRGLDQKNQARYEQNVLDPLGFYFDTKVSQRFQKYAWREGWRGQRERERGRESGQTGKEHFYREDSSCLDAQDKNTRRICCFTLHKKQPSRTPDSRFERFAV